MVCFMCPENLYLLFSLWGLDFCYLLWIWRYSGSCIAEECLVFYKLEVGRICHLLQWWQWAPADELYLCWVLNILTSVVAVMLMVDSHCTCEICTGHILGPSYMSLVAAAPWQTHGNGSGRPDPIAFYYWKSQAPPTVWGSRHELCAQCCCCVSWKCFILLCWYFNGKILNIKECSALWIPLPYPNTGVHLLFGSRYII